MTNKAPQELENLAVVPTNRRNIGWNAKAFGDALGINDRQAFHQLERGHVRADVAQKVGGKWCIDLDKLKSLDISELFVKPTPKSPKPQAAKRHRSRKVALKPRRQRKDESALAARVAAE